MNIIFVCALNIGLSYTQLLEPCVKKVRVKLWEMLKMFELLTLGLFSKIQTLFPVWINEATISWSNLTTAWLFILLTVSFSLTLFAFCDTRHINPQLFLISPLHHPTIKRKRDWKKPEKGRKHKTRKAHFRKFKLIYNPSLVSFPCVPVDLLSS